MKQSVFLLQLPIPPLVPGGVKGNVPLAGAYLKMYAELQGLGTHYQIDILPAPEANTLGDWALVDRIVAQKPAILGFSCYLWNIDRSLWIASRVKELLPEVVVIIGGPEVTSDNQWVLEHPAIDYASIGEGEQTFADFLAQFAAGKVPDNIAGLYVAPHRRASEIIKKRSLSLVEEKATGCSSTLPGFTSRKPLAKLDEISSPYLNGILDAADERMLLLETIRGCIFNCKFCYYPKSYDALYFVSEDLIRANLRHAVDRNAKEVVFLDPTLNQRKGFDDFLKLIIEENPGRKMACFGELRAEGIKDSTAALLYEAGFTEVEVGLQSIDPAAMELMDRKNNLKAIERGCQAMLKENIDVKVDLIIGLPGDTADSVRRSFQYLKNSGIYSDVQVFNLAILPGTSFRQEANDLGLTFQPRPPYYVRRTPTLAQEEMFELMQYAAEVFEMEWDPLPEPVLPKLENPGMLLDAEGNIHAWLVDLDAAEPDAIFPNFRKTVQAFTFRFRGKKLGRQLDVIRRCIRRLLEANPFSTLQIILEPMEHAEEIDSGFLVELWSVCQVKPTYMDRYYALQPDRPIGAKRIVLLVDEDVNEEWMEEMEAHATISSRLFKPGADAEVVEENIQRN